MPLGGCAGFAGAAGLSCACARLPRRDDRQRAACCPRARKRRQREYDVGFPQASGRPLHAGDSGSPGLSTEPTGRPRRLRPAGGGDRRAAATRRPPRRAFVRRRDLAARGGAGGRPAVTDRERAAGVRRGTWESGGRGVPGENAGRSRRAARLPRVLSAARGQLAKALRPPAGSARGRGAGGDGRALAPRGADSARRARGRAVSEARRHGRAQPGLRRGRRRARAAPRRAARRRSGSRAQHSQSAGLRRDPRPLPRVCVIGLPLETERLVIRPFEPERDAEPLHELWGDAEAMQFVPSGPRASVDQTRELLESLSGRAPEGLGFWALEERGGGRLVGGVGLFPLAWKGPELELAYHVVPAAWVAMRGNVASRRVMEKLGMSLEGPRRYRDLDVVRYSISRPT